VTLQVEGANTGRDGPDQRALRLNMTLTF